MLGKWDVSEPPAGREELTACAFQCAVENEELVQHLGAAKDAQRQLTAEVSGSPSFHRGPQCQVGGNSLSR